MQRRQKQRLDYAAQASQTRYSDIHTKFGAITNIESS
jgi:hypothetical protein